MPFFFSPCTCSREYGGHFSSKERSLGLLLGFFLLVEVKAFKELSRTQTLSSKQVNYLAELALD